MSYNILCDNYVTTARYGYCPRWALLWEYRKDAILKEIDQAGADIVALQVMYVHVHILGTLFHTKISHQNCLGVIYMYVYAVYLSFGQAFVIFSFHSPSSKLTIKLWECTE